MSDDKKTPEDLKDEEIDEASGGAHSPLRHAHELVHAEPKLQTPTTTKGGRRHY